MGALDKICEDSAAELDQNDPAFVQLLVQSVLHLLQHPDPKIRSKALRCVNQFLLIRAQAIWNHLDEYLTVLYRCTNDPDPQVKQCVCQAFTSIVEMSPETLKPVFSSVIDFMLYATQSDCEQLALEAADFWMVVIEQEMLQIDIQDHIEKYPIVSL